MSRHVLSAYYTQGIVLDFGQRVFPRFPLSEPQTSCHTEAKPPNLAPCILGFSAHVHFLASYFWHGPSLLLGLNELTLLGSVPPKGCGECSGRVPSSKAFGWSPEVFLILAAILPWDGAWRNVVSETASWVRAD